MNQKAETNLVFFSEKYNVDDFDQKPIPFDIFHQSGAILATKGTIVSKEKLKVSFVYSNVSQDPQQVLFPLQNQNNQGLNFQGHSPENIFHEHLLSDSYEEEHAEIIDSKLNYLDFEPIPEVKANLRKNIYQVKELFQKKIADNAIHLSTKNNQIISKNITNYLETIMEFPAYSSDYIEMVSAIRSSDNYITFSHAISVAFYSLSIARKLQMLREDLIIKNNMGRWLPIKTEKNPKQLHSIPISSQILKYFDRQKENIQMKYKPEIAVILYDKVHDLIHDYSNLQNPSEFPSLKVNYDYETRENLTIAAINCDIGKLCLPNYILNKKEELNTDDWKIIKQHPVYSVSKLKEVSDYSNKILAYILGHHNFDNKIGYPIFNHHLPEESKIISICDIYDAMTSPRNYGKHYTHEQALQYISGLYDGCYIDRPLYLTAIHTFDEYNHIYSKNRNKSLFL